MLTSKYIRKIPVTYSCDETKKFLDDLEDWFYLFEFSNGTRTEIDTLLNTIHQTRADLIFPFLDFVFEDKWGICSCIDIACNQGWFATQIALRGGEVIGFDLRDEHIEKANLIKKMGQLTNVNYHQKNLFDIDTNSTGERETFDIVLLLGILYHLDNPMGAIKKARELTNKVCVIETQVTKEMNAPQILWGSDESVRYGTGVGVFFSDTYHAEGGNQIVIVPTLAALYQMLYAAGFNYLHLVVPSQKCYVQYPDFDRVVIFAFT